MSNRVKILHNGYSSNIIEEKDENLPFVRANCSCVLVTGSSNCNKYTFKCVEYDN